MKQDARLAPVDLVVVNWNGRRHVARLVAALRALRGPVGRLIVVDGASEDGSAFDIAAARPGGEVLQLGRNAGPSVARNAGLAAARTERVLLVDNDAYLRPDVLERLLEAALARPDAAVAQPRSVFADDPARVHYDGGALHHAGLIALRNFYAPLESARGAGVVEVDACVSVCLLVDKGAVLAAGGFDERMFILFEDLDLSFRLRAMGRAIVSVEEALCLHGGGTPDLSFRDGPRYPGSRVRHHSKNRWLHIANNYRARTILCCLPSFAAYEAAQFAFALAAGAAGEWWRGKREWWADRAHWRARRAGLERARTTPDRRLLVGGPLTLTPAAARGGRALVARLLDGWMRAWWWILRPLAG
ncbi:MAG: glycosyltransferase family 2 protein [Planctomycetia bacterium]